jgi:ubiquinol-cytochrome c reductase cytochrome b subunit
LLGAGLLTAAAVNEDYRARWTSQDRFADFTPLFEQLGQDNDKIAAHFSGQPEKAQEYRHRLKEYESYRKSQEYLHAVEEADQEAARVVTLARGPAQIPVAGAITLLRDDPKTQGPRLFAAYCASCHTHAAPGDDANAAEREKSTAPNLYGFASRKWIAGLLNPQQIAGPEYFGHTSHAEGTMAGFVTDTLASWPAEEVSHIAAALSAEAQLKSQAAADKKDAEQIEAGRKLIAGGERCASCHHFREAGELGSAPDLTGYGSREWIAGMISDPKHARFYREDNDRMPSFAANPDPARNTLSPRQIGLLAGWLRGDWYEPAAEPAHAAAK